MAATITINIMTTGMAISTASVADGDPNMYSQEVSERAGNGVTVAIATTQNN